MTAHNGAGVELADPNAWLRELVTTGRYVGEVVALAAHLAAACGPALCTAASTRELAPRVRQRRNNLIERLDVLIRDGWIDPGKHQNGTRRVLTLTRPALLSVTEAGGTGSSMATATGSSMATATGSSMATATGSSMATGPVAPGLPVHPPTPPRGWEGGSKNLPPSAPQAPPVQSPLVAAVAEGFGLTPDERTEGEVVAELLADADARLACHSLRERRRLAEVCASAMGRGWTAEQIVAKATLDIPMTIAGPSGFVANRCGGRPPKRLAFTVTTAAAEYCTKPEHFMQPLPCRGCRADEAERRAYGAAG